MQSSGGTEALRNLVDSDLPRSLKVIYENYQRFGPKVFALCESSSRIPLNANR